jgi:hypothetical protein
MAAWPDTWVDTDELRRYVVQIRSEQDGILGTGFFVAPNWVLTCAHVVHGSRKVIVVPDGSVSASPLLASVDVASSPPEPGTSSNLWPFPDLALLHLAGHAEHPCAFLDVQSPMGGSEVQAWGYPEREQGVLPQGSPASFRLEGGPGEDGWLKFKSGEAAPGLSGAPLVCGRRRAVVGVVVASRQLYSDMGGYAAPISSLLNGDERLPADVAAHGALVKVMNLRAVVEKDGRAWHRVLPIQGVSRILKRPWTSFVKQDDSNPSDLLLPESGVVPYLFRETVLREAVAWCDQDSPFAIARVLGDVGSGKTRFALELCKSLCERGWMAGFWRHGKAVAEVPLPRLVVVDFAEVDVLSLVWEAINDLRDSASVIAPVRVLLLTRTRSGGQLPDAVNVLSPDWDIDAACAELDASEREELYKSAVTEFARAWHSGPGTEVPSTDMDSHLARLPERRYAAPLEVLFEALDLVLGESVPGGRTLSAVERVLERERRFWQRSDPHLTLELKEAVAALSTLAGAATDEEAQALLTVVPGFPKAAASEWHQLVAWHARLYGGLGVLNPVRPDRLGEALVSQFLAGQGDGGATLVLALLSLSSDSQVARCLDVLSHLVASESSGHRSATKRTGSYELIKVALVRCSDDLEQRALHARDSVQVPNPIASAYDRLVEALGVLERRQEVQRREALAQEDLADKSAREEKTRRDISDSVSLLDQLPGPDISQMMSRHAIPTPAESQAARERAELNQRIHELERDLSAVKQARQDAQGEIDQLRSERVGLDKLIALKKQLEEQLQRQLRQVKEEQQRREEAEDHRKQAEQREDAIQQQLETQFLRAEYEALEREKVERSLRAMASELELAEHDWDLQSSVARREWELRLEAEQSNELGQQIVGELRSLVISLQASRRKLFITASACGVIACAAIIGILVLVIS